MNLPVGKFYIIPILFSWLSVSSCILIPAEKPLNPRLLFTLGSEFLENTESIAVKGAIDFEDDYNRESGSFNLIINRGDSLAFLIEGPFKIDIFRLIIVNQTAFAIDRESDTWTVAATDEKLIIPDYGIRGITPDLLGHYIFPQFYLSGDSRFNSDNMTISKDGYVFHLNPSRDQKSFTLTSAEQDLSAVYSRRKDTGGGYYPSKIAISPHDESWRISLEIDRIKLNPEIPARIWDRD
ncbi:MAG: hypothetical protein JSU85_15800 [Candidatus Zixiibacteriota bacterium]|nr:MAG: hypothetical protein JSU85_15800 [candidate division Zixibacteria bacterium]